MDAAFVIQNSDEQLFTSVKDGDKTALEIIYKKYYTGLYYYAKKCVNDNGAAKDIVQECFLKIWENRHSTTIFSSLSAYLYRTVYNHSLNHLKRKKVDKKHLENHKEQIESIRGNFELSLANGQSILIAKEFNEIVNSAIEDLPEKCRNIFKLSRFKGLKNHEIATELDISLNTVQSQISIALKKLRIKLEPLLGSTE